MKIDVGKVYIFTNDYGLVRVRLHDKVYYHMDLTVDNSFGLQGWWVRHTLRIGNYTRSKWSYKENR